MINFKGFIFFKQLTTVGGSLWPLSAVKMLRLPVVDLVILDTELALMEEELVILSSQDLIFLKN